MGDTIDTLFMLRRAMDLYSKNMGEKSYQDVLQALVICVRGDVPLWMPATIVEKDGEELVKPGMVTDTDDNYYYIICIEDHDFGQMDEGITKIKIDTKNLLMRVAADRSISGICLNPWDGGCFIPTEHVMQILASFQ